MSFIYIRNSEVPAKAAACRPGLVALRSRPNRLTNDTRAVLLSAGIFPNKVQQGMVGKFFLFPHVHAQIWLVLMQAGPHQAEIGQKRLNQTAASSGGCGYTSQIRVDHSQSCVWAAWLLVLMTIDWAWIGMERM